MKFNVERFMQDYRDGKDKFARGLNLSYCANDAERAGYQAALADALGETEPDQELEELYQMNLEVDEAQSEYTDWRM